jgi:UDP-N-acetylmuramyl pentapeptide phosphotransferase/UDP-N-acetylglucosamine-1-phosphate transferase
MWSLYKFFVLSHYHFTLWINCHFLTCLFFFFCSLFFFFNGIIDDYWYVQEFWDDWDTVEHEDLAWQLIFFFWEINVGGMSEEDYPNCYVTDGFFEFIGCHFYPDDNWLYPEFRYFFIFCHETSDWFL